MWRVACTGTVASLLAAASFAYADEITYGYDPLGRLTSVSVGGATAYYDYDAAGNITAIRRQSAVSSSALTHGVADVLSASAQALDSTVASARASSR
ncbi:sugar-binding protein [Paraburkholderia xenovorans]